MGHTDVVPGERRRLAARPVRRRDRRRRWCGAAARSTCSTSPRRWRSRSATSPSRASRPRARSSTSRSPTRRPSARGAPSTCVEHERDAVNADYVLTESGGFQMPTPQGPRLPVIVGEKGTYWSNHGARHARATRRSRSAPTTRSSPRPRSCAGSPSTGRRRTIHETWRRFVEGVDFGPEWNAALLDEDDLREFCEQLPLGLARQAHACTHTTFAPTIVARRHQDQRDPRPGRARGRHPHAARPDGRPTSRKLLDDALGDLADARRDQVVRRERVDASPDRHAAVGRAGPGVVAGSSKARRSCRS